MRRFCVIFFAALFLCAGCSEPEPAPPTTVNVPKYPVALEMPSDWIPNPEKHPFDLQYLAKDQSGNTGLFVYKRSDFDEGTTLEKILELAVDDIRSKRENFEELQAVTEHKNDKQRSVSAVFKGEKNGSLNHYRFSAVEFTEDPETVVTVLQVSLPERWERNRPVLEEIVKSIKPESLKG